MALKWSSQRLTSGLNNQLAEGVGNPPQPFASSSDGWMWRRVADRLAQDGQKVFAPMLTGLGERSHLLRRDIDLDTDVVNPIEWETEVLIKAENVLQSFSSDSSR